jgi:hypothetical protein
LAISAFRSSGVFARNVDAVAASCSAITANRLIRAWILDLAAKVRAF